MTPVVAEPGLRQFLLQNLERRRESGAGVAISRSKREMSNIAGFPELSDRSNYPGSVLLFAVRYRIIYNPNIFRVYTRSSCMPESGLFREPAIGSMEQTGGFMQPWLDSCRKSSNLHSSLAVGYHDAKSISRK